MRAKTVPVNELVELLRDHRVWAEGGSTNFDGDRDDSYDLVSRWAIHALAEVAPTAAPLDLLAEAVVRSHRHIDNIHYSSYAAPIPEQFMWTTKELEPFGSGLLDAIHALQRSTDQELRERAEILLDDFATRNVKHP